MNIIATRYGPVEPEQVDILQWYEIKGHDSLGDAIPGQIFIPLSPPRMPPSISFYTLVCEAWVFCLLDGFDQLIDYHQHDFPLASINLREHGRHDRHLERIELKPDVLFHRAILRRWREIEWKRNLDLIRSVE